MHSLDHCPRAVLGQLKGILTDLDGTLTTKGRIEAETYAALSELKEAGLFVAVVTGRPAGWGEMIARTFPVDACIVENGGLAFVRDRKGGIHRRYYTDDESLRARHRRKLERIVREVIAEVPGAQLSFDSRYTEVDLAIDWNEDVKLSPEQAAQIEAAAKARGASAVRSNVHVNVWLGGFDKASACERLLVEEAKARFPRDAERFAFVGDAPNDAPLFARFPLSVGVADVKRHRKVMEALPTFVTHSRGGLGFRELAAAILVAKDLLA
jgi:HAD superfamily hydrolase (TIGR01484 family)